MSATMTAAAAYRSVVRSVEKIRNDDPATVATMSPGDTVRQGDLYLTRLDRAIPGGKPAPSRQLAPGNSQGSRHVALGDIDVLAVPEAEAVAMLNLLVPSTRGETLFVGPMIVARGTVEVAHPEHGNRTLPGDACYLVTYQRTWADEARRALD